MRTYWWLKPKQTQSASNLNFSHSAGIAGSAPAERTGEESATQRGQGVLAWLWVSWALSDPIACQPSQAFFRIMGSSERPRINALKAFAVNRTCEGPSKASWRTEDSEPQGKRHLVQTAAAFLEHQGTPRPCCCPDCFIYQAAQFAPRVSVPLDLTVNIRLRAWCCFSKVLNLLGCNRKLSLISTAAANWKTFWRYHLVSIQKASRAL